MKLLVNDFVGRGPNEIPRECVTVTGFHRVGMNLEFGEKGNLGRAAKKKPMKVTAVNTIIQRLTL
jgi:hypothetical protein